MRQSYLLVFTLLYAVNAVALEKAQVYSGPVESDEWLGSYDNVFPIAYYNSCSGYVWLWSGFSDGDQVGVRFDELHDEQSQLHFFHTLHWDGAPSGYGFTGTVSVYEDENRNGCPDEEPVYLEPFLPVETGSREERVVHSILPHVGGSIVVLTIAGDANPLTIPTDQGHRPCIPPRDARSFVFGSASSQYCPGEALFAMGASCEFLWVFDHVVPISVDQSSWSGIKSLYR